MKTEKEKTAIMAYTLLIRWDCVAKVKAIQYLRELYPNSNLNVRIRAFDIAFK